MATKIVTKNSSTASAVPTASDLVQGELAVNVADKRLFTEDSGGSIVELGTNPSTLTVTGEITANGGIALGDNDKATFGAGDDLEIYHDGSNSHIKDTATGNLNISGNDIQILNAASNEAMAYFAQDGSVTLYHNGSEKLATTATGIDVTGTVTMDGLTVNAGTNKVVLANNFATTGNTDSPKLAFYSFGDVATYPVSGPSIKKVNTGSYGAGDLVIYQHGPYDFTNEVEALRIDSSGNVGIGITSSLEKFTVANTSSGIVGRFTNNTNQTLDLGVISGSGAAGGVYYNSANSGYHAFQVGGTERMRLDAIGNLLVGQTASNGFGGTPYDVNGSELSKGYLNLNRDDLAHATQIQFGKNGAVAGRIHTDDRLSIGTGSTGIYFYNSGNSILPYDNSAATPATRNAAIDLGSSGSRFKDLYLSSTATMGGLTVDTTTPFMSFKESGATKLFIGESSAIGGGAGYYDFYAVTGLGQRFFTNSVERMRIDSSGNVGINNSSPVEMLTIGSTSDTNVRVQFLSSTTGANTIQFGDGTGASAYSGYINYTHSDNALVFATGGSERMRITSAGSLYLGAGYTTWQSNSFAVEGLSSGAYTVTSHINGAPSGQPYSYFFYNNGVIGSITQNGTTGVAYNTSSDYRLKENVVPMTGSIDRVKALKPSRFNFIADADTTVDGFLAHEAQAVVPECVTGTKDAMKDEEYEVTAAIEEVRDEDGNITTEAVEAVMGTRSVPDMQGIDQSKLVPLLTAALQEAITKIESLTTRIAALEE